MKKSVKIIIAIVAVLVVLGATVAGLFFGGVFDLLKPTRKAWTKQVQKALGLEKVKVTDYADFLDEYKDIYNKPFTSKMNVSAELNISELDKDVQKTINNSKIVLETNRKPDSKENQVKITLNSQDEEVIQLDVITNKEKVAIGSKDLYDKYLAVSLNDLFKTAEKSGVKTSTNSVIASPDYSKLMEKLEQINPYDLIYISKDDLKSLEKAYSKAIENSIDKDNYTKKGNVKVKVDGKDVRATGYYLTLSGKETYELIESLTKTIKDDETTSKLIAEKANILLDAIGEDKIEANDSKKIVELVMDSLMEQLEYSAYGDELTSAKKLKDMDDQGIQIVVYSKWNKPVRLEVNYVKDMKDIYDTNTFLSIEYGKKKDIYTFLPGESNSVVITDEYSKKSKEERKGTLTVEYKSIKFGTIDYEFINKKHESKLYLKVNVPILNVEASMEFSSKGNYKKEPVEVLYSLDAKFGKESIKLKAEGTIDYTADVSIPSLSSDNSVDIFKLDSKEQSKLIEDIMKKASEVLPARLKLLGINIKAEDIYSTQKTTTTTATIPTISGITKTPTTTTTTPKSSVSTDEKLIAKKEETDEAMGKYIQIIEVGYKNGTAVSATMAMEFNDEKTATTILTALKMANDDSLKDYDISQDGKKIVIKMDIDSFIKQEELSKEDLKKDTLKKDLEETGYTVTIK